MLEFRSAVEVTGSTLSGENASTDFVQRPTSACACWRPATFPELPYRLPSNWVMDELFSFDLLLPHARPAASIERKSAEFTDTSLTIPFKIASINIRSLCETGKIKFVADRAVQRKIDVLCIQETRLSDSVASMTVEGY
eukprot:982060-Amphidinium_carterae.1